jgi:hypothetical protein
LALTSVAKSALISALLGPDLGGFAAEPRPGRRPPCR